MELRFRLVSLAVVVVSMAAGVWLAFAISLPANSDDASNPIWATGWVLTGLAAVLFAVNLFASRRAAKAKEVA